MSAHFSAIMMVGALVLPVVSTGTGTATHALDNTAPPELAGQIETYLSNYVFLRAGSE